MMDNKGPFLVEFVVSKPIVVHLICNMICRHVAGLTSYVVCVDMVN